VTLATNTHTHAAFHNELYALYALSLHLYMLYAISLHAKISSL